MTMISQFLHQGFLYVVPFVVLLGVLIFVHELGHFMVAKFFGVRVETFSLGFGRKILRKKFGDTTYCISIIPFGGYVKMFGDESDANIPVDQQKYSFNHQKVLPRIAIVLAGPTMNALFAIVLFTAIMGIGEEVLKPKLGDIFPNTAAYKAGLRTDDVVTEVNGTKVDRWDSIKKQIEDSEDQPLKFTVDRSGNEVNLTATPKAIANKNVLISKAFVGDIDGLTYLHLGSAVGVSDPTSAAAQSEIKTGDIIRKIGDKEILLFTDLETTLRDLAKAGRTSVTLEVERASSKSPIRLSLDIPKDNPMAGMEPSDLFLSSVLPKSAAAEAGIEVGDRLVSIDNVKLTRWEDVVSNVQNYKEGQAPLKIVFIRNGKENKVEVTPRLLKQADSTGVEQKNYALGIITGLVYATPETFIAKEPNLGDMLKRGFGEMSHWTALTAMSFVKLAEGKVSSKSIGGPLMIGKLASETWRIGISPFLKVMAIISINLFLLNLLPIPVLDGGHLLFFVIELFKGSPLSLKKMEIMQQVGLFLLLGLMAYSFFNDVVRFFTAS